MAVPTSQAARNGFPGDPAAVDASAQINQFLDSHGVTPIYQGAEILTPLTPNGGYHATAELVLDDWGQPFTLSGTSIGRVTIPVQAAGAGADMLVSLCADNAGNPGTVLASARIPKEWIAAVSAPDGLPAAGPLQTAHTNTLRLSTWNITNWAAADSGSGVAGNPSSVNGGNYLIQVGGQNSSNNAVANVFTIGYAGGNALANAVPQPSLPQAVYATAGATTADYLVVIGGALNSTTDTANVYVASWDPNSGTVGAWTQQTALPVATNGHAAAAWTDPAGNEYIYVVNGSSSYYASLQNGQLGSWADGPDLPVQLFAQATIQAAGFLIVAGGVIEPAGTTMSTAVYYAQIQPDGSLAGWQVGPPMPVGVQMGGRNYDQTPNGLIVYGGSGNSGFVTDVQLLTFTADGPGQWQHQQQNYGADVVVFPSGPGTWELFDIFATYYAYATVLSIPRISVPLGVTGLTNGSTYHVLIQQAGGDINNNLTTGVEQTCLPKDALYRAVGGNTWTDKTGYSIPIEIYDTTPGQGLPIHLISDTGASIATLVQASTDGTLLGLLEATQFEDGTTLPQVTALTYDSMRNLVSAAPL